nr:RcOsp2 [Ceratobasidium cereale]
MRCFSHYERPRNVGSMPETDVDVESGLVSAHARGNVMKLQIRVDENGIISDVKFTIYGCGLAIASSSCMTKHIALSSVSRRSSFIVLCLPRMQSALRAVTNSASNRVYLFALRFTAPILLRIIAAPLQATPAILRSVRTNDPRASRGSANWGTGPGCFVSKVWDTFLPQNPMRWSSYTALPFFARPTPTRSNSSGLFLSVDAAVPRTSGCLAPLDWASSASTSPDLGLGRVGLGLDDVAILGHARERDQYPWPVCVWPWVVCDRGSEHALLVVDAYAKARRYRVYRKPAPAFVPHALAPAGPMTMPVPIIAQPVPPPPPSSSPLSPTSPMPPVSASHNAGPAPVPVLVPNKRNSSLLRKFRAGGGSGRTASGMFKHPPSPPVFRSGTEPGKERRSLGKGRAGRRSLASGEIIYETPLSGSESASGADWDEC